MLSDAIAEGVHLYPVSALPLLHGFAAPLLLTYPARKNAGLLDQERSLPHGVVFVAS